jgi:hypothetical protein
MEASAISDSVADLGCTFKLDECLIFFNIFCEFSKFLQFLHFDQVQTNDGNSRSFRMLQSENALASSLRLYQIMCVLHTQPKAIFFNHLHVAVVNLHVTGDNDVFAKLPRCCSVDHPFW